MQWKGNGHFSEWWITLLVVQSYCRSEYIYAYYLFFLMDHLKTVEIKREILSRESRVQQWLSTLWYLIKVKHLTLRAFARQVNVSKMLRLEKEHWESNMEAHESGKQREQKMDARRSDSLTCESCVGDGSFHIAWFKWHSCIFSSSAHITRVEGSGKHFIFVVQLNSDQKNITKLNSICG